MTRDEAKEVAKAMLPAYLIGKGINLQKPFRCLSPAHADRHPSMSYRPCTNTVQCFGCGEHGDIFDVIRMEYGLDKSDHKKIFALTYRILGIDVEGRKTATNIDLPQKTARNAMEEIPSETDYTAFFCEAAAHISDTDYAKRRGLSDEVIHRFYLGFVRDWKNPSIKEATLKRIPATPRLIIPTSFCSYVARDTRGSMPKRQRPYAKLKVGHVRIFNTEVLRNERPVFVTEGEIDALSVETVGGSACAMGSTGMVGAFLREVAEHRPKLPLLIALDRDAAGMKAKDKLVQGLTDIGIPFVCVNISGKYKDANELLVARREEFAEAVHRAEELAMELRENYTEKENLVHDLNETLREMKQEPLGLVDFWEKAVNAIKDTILEMQEAATALQILRIWSAGLERAAKEFGMEQNSEVGNIRKETEDLLRGKDISNKWEEIFELIARLDSQNAVLMKAMHEKSHENPLLSVPAVREAIPLGRERRTASPEKLYFSAVKSAVLRDDGITGKAADVQAAKLLIRCRVSDAVIYQGLMASPRLRGKINPERKAAIMDWLGKLRGERTGSR